ncbi:hypothetical protein XENTR_v10015205 [Xenopus tropicalis]|nr:hypothetical protein XENTR_v10015205 [Xenopus tropicalis]
MSLRWALTNHLTQAPKGCFTIKFPVLQLRAFSSRKPAGDVIVGSHGNTEVFRPPMWSTLIRKPLQLSH